MLFKFCLAFLVTLASAAFNEHQYRSQWDMENDHRDPPSVIYVLPDSEFNKYQNGKVYKIVDIGYNKFYIGSTCEELSRRMSHHRAKFKRFLNGSKETYMRSYDIFNEYGVENCKNLLNCEK